MFPPAGRRPRSKQPRAGCEERASASCVHREIGHERAVGAGSHDDLVAAVLELELDEAEATSSRRGSGCSRALGRRRRIDLHDRAEHARAASPGRASASAAIEVEVHPLVDDAEEARGAGAGCRAWSAGRRPRPRARRREVRGVDAAREGVHVRVPRRASPRTGCGPPVKTRSARLQQLGLALRAARAARHVNAESSSMQS